MMAASGVPEIAIYPEGRAAKSPSTTRVIEVFEPLSAQQLVVGDRIVKSFAPEPSDLQLKILERLQIPASAYQRC